MQNIYDSKYVKELFDKMSKSVILLLIGMFNFYGIYGQQNDSLNANITIQNRIDSLVFDIENNQNCTERISEGSIMRDHKTIGGFSTYFLTENSTNKILRISNQQSTDYYYKTIYYYDNDQLIYVIFEIEDWNSGSKKVIYSVKYYFQNDNLIFASEEDNIYSTTSEILVKGKKYIQKK